MPDGLGMVEGVVIQTPVIIGKGCVQLRAVLLQGHAVDRVERTVDARGMDDAGGVDPMDARRKGAGSEAGGHAGQGE